MASFDFYFIYFLGCALAFFINALHMLFFINDVGNKYPTWQKVNVFVLSSIIISALSWIGCFFVGVSLGIRIFKD